MKRIYISSYIIFSLVYGITAGSRNVCLTGDIMDLQNWVHENGTLNVTDPKLSELSLDFSESSDLTKDIEVFTRSDQTVHYISFARLKLKCVPSNLASMNTDGVKLSEMIRFLTLYGNEFQGRGTRMWSAAFCDEQYQELIELDMRNCKIQRLTAKVFGNMPKLRSLYLGGNNLVEITTDAFAGLNSLQHLDVSGNADGDETTSSHEGLQIDEMSFDTTPALRSLDFSNTKLSFTKNVFSTLPVGLKRLSLCNCEISDMQRPEIRAQLEILDISGNVGILEDSTWFGVLNGTLRYLYAKNTDLKRIACLYGFHQLRVLNLQHNNIQILNYTTVQSWRNMEILDLGSNRMPSWIEMTFSQLEKLQFLSLRTNNLNLITELMLKDMRHVEYVSLASNSFVCNCAVQQFIERAVYAQNYTRNNAIPYQNNKFKLGPRYLHYQNSYEEYNAMVADMKPVSTYNKYNVTTPTNFYKFKIIDYHNMSYTCTDFDQRKRFSFLDEDVCSMNSMDHGYNSTIKRHFTYIYVLIGVSLILVAAGVVIAWKWWYIRYFYIIVKNAATLSLMRNDTLDTEHQENSNGALYTYDVFVSYCNGDREWVLKHLLPKIEQDNNISVCLHERDFQVGLTILENIVSCMDRSRVIMLVISKEFLLSQWCQFEMHLAQHRLIETRRENLILILLEDIPRRKRPNTLHYLMLTKTYIVWDSQNQTLFWQRVKKALLQRGNCSSYA